MNRRSVGHIFSDSLYVCTCHLAAGVASKVAAAVSTAVHSGAVLHHSAPYSAPPPPLCNAVHASAGIAATKSHQETAVAAVELQERDSRARQEGKAEAAQGSASQMELEMRSSAASDTSFAT